MILQRLAEHYDRIVAGGEVALAPPGFSVQKVSFCLVLDPHGTLHSIEDLRRPEGKALRPRSLVVPGQSKPSGSGLKPCFLWDSPEYLLGWSADPAKAERAPKAFAAFRDAHLALEPTIADPAFTAVCAFLRGWSPEQAAAHAEELAEKAANFGVFRILDGDLRYVHDRVSVPVVASAEEAPEEQAFCLVSGELAPAARLHEPKIKGVAGAQTSGALLVSFNASAFTSYGKDQSFNAPVSVSTTFKYTNALNHLLAQRERRIGLGDATVVFWADHDTLLLDAMDNLFLGSFDASEMPVGEDQTRVNQARRLLTQLRDGTENQAIEPDGQPTRFFILGLSPNASRLSVRLWVEQDASELQGKLRSHLQDIALKGTREDRVLPLWRIVAATGRAEHDPNGRLKGFDTKAVSPQLAGDLARSVLTGAPYPQSLLATMVRRIRSDGEVAFARVSAIKAVLVRNARLTGAPLEVPMELDTQNTDIAYRCGRLFAVLEDVQRLSVKQSSNSELNSTIKDRYFSSASSTPGLVFPRLFRLAQHHLAKIEPVRLRNYFERLMGEAMTPHFEFPRQLNLAQQGNFIVGYYQQRFSKKESSSEENA